MYISGFFWINIIIIKGCFVEFVGNKNKEEDNISQRSCLFQSEDEDGVTARLGGTQGGWNVPVTDYDSEASTDITYGRGGK